LDVTEIDEFFVRKRIPPRKSNSHKGQNGIVCVVGGSSIYHGAPFLCAKGALRTGSDLVYLAVPKQIVNSVRALSPDFIVYPLPDSKLTRGSTNRLCSWIKNVDSVAFGPGLGNQKIENLKYFVEKISEKTKTIVLDADSLRQGITSSLKIPSTLTPHSGEFERLFGVRLPEGEKERIETAFEFSKKEKKTLLVKGYIDVISDGSNVAVNRTHTPAMTVGGTGDVLTGICASLLSKGLSPFDAACCAAFINGRAGILAYQEKGLHITASDVADKIPYAMKDFDSIE
jgi:ADP-dependent NAD(P)H-hydrate dehydratase